MAVAQIFMTDHDMTIEVLKDGDNYTIGSMTLHETLALDELISILDFCVESAKTMPVICSNMATVKYPAVENSIYSITVILTEGVPNILIGADGEPLNRPYYDEIVKKLDEEEVEKLQNVCQSLRKEGIAYWGLLKTSLRTQIIGFSKGCVQITYNCN